MERFFNGVYHSKYNVKCRTNIEHMILVYIAFIFLIIDLNSFNLRLSLEIIISVFLFIITNVSIYYSLKIVFVGIVIIGIIGFLSAHLFFALIFEKVSRDTSLKLLLHLLNNCAEVTIRKINSIVSNGTG